MSNLTENNTPKERASEKVLSRIRKLYAMSQENESSPREASIALKRCQSLMFKYGIQESDLETSEFSITSAYEIKTKVPTYIKLLAKASSVLNDCLIVKCGHVLEFRGYAIDAEVAKLTNDYLCETLNRYLKQAKANGQVHAGRSASHDFRIGFAVEVLRRCEELDSQRRNSELNDSSNGTALVVKKLSIVREECGAGLSKAPKSRYRYRKGDAMDSGRRAGSTVSLNRQVSGSPVTKALS